MTTEWQDCNDEPNLPDKDAQSVVLNDAIFVSGHDGDPVLHKYSMTKKSWYRLPVEVSDYALTTYNSKVVLVGGKEGSKYSSKCFRVLDDGVMEDKLNSFQESSQSVFEKVCCAASYENYLFVVISSESIESVGVFDGDEWIRLPTFEGNQLKKSTILIKEGHVYVSIAHDNVYHIPLKSLLDDKETPKWEKLNTERSEISEYKSNLTSLGDHVVTVKLYGKNLQIYAWSARFQKWIQVENVPEIPFHDDGISISGVTSAQPQQMELWAMGRIGQRLKVNFVKILIHCKLVTVI